MATHINPPKNLSIKIVGILENLLLNLNISITHSIEIIMVFIILVLVEIVIVLFINKFMPFILKFPNLKIHSKN